MLSYSQSWPTEQAVDLRDSLTVATHVEAQPAVTALRRRSKRNGTMSRAKLNPEYLQPLAMFVVLLFLFIIEVSSLHPQLRALAFSVTVFIVSLIEHRVVES
ncbi:MAG: hypothetical protein M5U25_20815 [Planctomycetota bacterium]|nr:hypothetical protein [Planctomycetota bacterium]